MKLTVKTLIAAALVATSVTAAAQDPAIKGYFRINTLAGNSNNDNYVEVTGPFTAKPSLSLADAEKSAGSIIYVEAVQDGDSYRLTSLRSQGIDVAKDVVEADDYESALMGALENINDLTTDAVYAIVRQGFEYGYTSIARATVGTVFSIVASRLGNYNTSDDGYTSYDFTNIVADFNKNVTSKLDLGIRLKSVDYSNKAMQLYFDVPNLNAVCEWYNDPQEQERHNVFASAMLAMTNFLADFGVNLETFNASDVALFESWGQKLPESLVTDENGTVTTSFDTIFSDPDLLFTWIKWVGYYILNSNEDESGRFNLLLNRLGIGDISSKVQNHYITDLLAKYLPRLHPDTRVFLINGRVNNSDGNVSSAGTVWDAAGNTFGFANEREVEIAGNNGIFVLHPVDNDSQVLKVSPKQAGEDGHYLALYYDFPVKAGDNSTKFYTLSGEKTKEIDNSYGEGADVLYRYNEFSDALSEVAELTPFILECESGEDVKLLVGTGEFIFNELEPVQPDEPEKPENSLVLSEEETVEQYSISVKAYAQAEAANNLKGVLLPTELGSVSMRTLWGIDEETKVYSLADDAVILNGQHTRVQFVEANGTIEANQAVYVADTDPTTGFIFINDIPDTFLTGIENVEVTAPAKDNVLYDLRGIRVANPLPGHIYILNGKKIIIR